jgi:hypothetical protein
LVSFEDLSTDTTWTDRLLRCEVYSHLNISHLFLSHISQSVSPSALGMTDRSYQASDEDQRCLDLHLFVPSLVPHDNMCLFLLSDPSV